MESGETPRWCHSPRRGGDHGSRDEGHVVLCFVLGDWVGGKFGGRAHEEVKGLGFQDCSKAWVYSVSALGCVRAWSV